ncbi:hypothetical protein [uncultured Chitinophaga sp.]|uniref:hypothetical protein n=1 Tax=uncultured Chitinophaga sp. TaxID=339340 RepID=UPI0025D5B4B9|nr:hypothetical protein [uncultured Chitinophaga sp.]
MKKIYLLALGVITIALGCEPGKTATSNKDTAIVITGDSVVSTLPADSIPSEIYVAAVRSKMDSLHKILPSLTPQQAVLAYTTFKTFMDSVVLHLSVNEAWWTDHYLNTYSEEANDYRPGGDTLKRVKLLATAGIEPQYIGEGYTELTTEPYLYHKLFGPYLPADYKSYVEINAHEDTTLFSADAGIIIPWPEVGMRVHQWEVFVNTYPSSPLFRDAKAKYDNYLVEFLLGEDNTRTIEDGEMVPEIKAAFEAYAAQYPDTRSGAIVADFLKKSASEKDHDKLVEWVIKRTDEKK